MIAAMPIDDAAIRRHVDRVAVGIRWASILASGTAMAAVDAMTTSDHSGRVIHHSRLLGSGSAMPVTMANTALAPAIASSTGMCQR